MRLVRMCVPFLSLTVPLLFCSPAFALQQANASGETQATGQGYKLYTWYPYTTGKTITDYYADGEAIFRVDGQPEPNVEAAAGSSVFGGEVTAYGAFGYAFMVTGPNPGELVSLDIRVNMGATGLDSSWQSDVWLALNQVYLEKLDAGAPWGDVPMMFDGVISIQVAEDVPQWLGMYAQAGASGCSYLTTCGASANAWVDPTISISTSNPEAEDLGLEFSDGVGNAFPSVPEPDNAVLMFLGLAVALTAYRRRARSSTL